MPYIRLGTGKNIVLAFHGYGQDKNIFSIFEASNIEASFFCFDLPFHGQSRARPQDLPITKDLLAVFFDRFISEENISHFCLLGFSLGGKVALCLYEIYSEKIKSLILIAPDGVSSNRWYTLATTPGITHCIFRYITFRRRLLNLVVKLAKGLHLTDKKVIRFALKEMNTPAKRYRVYHTWMIFRNLKPDIPLLLLLANTNKTYVQIFTGRYDKVIDIKTIHKFASKIKTVEHTVLNTGHTALFYSVPSQPQFKSLFYV